MTTILAGMPSEKERWFWAFGHATGSERVCAAVSALAYTLAAYLVNREDVEVTEMRLEKGNVSLSWTGGDKDLIALQTVCLGLMQLVKTNPDYIRTGFSEAIFKNF